MTTLADEIAAALPCPGKCAALQLAVDDKAHAMGCPSMWRPAVLALIERREADWRRLVVTEPTTKDREEAARLLPCWCDLVAEPNGITKCYGPDCMAFRRQQLATALAARTAQHEAELALVRGAMAADDERLAAASVRVWGENRWGCDAPEQMADLIEHLRAKLAAAEAQIAAGR